MANLHLELIRQALAEDGAEADVTTLCTVPMEQQTQANIIARQTGVIAGLAVAVATFRELDQRVSVEKLLEDGAVVQPGQVLAHISGPARSVLSAERVALNFLGHLSGIATITAQCVRALEAEADVILLDNMPVDTMRSAVEFIRSASPKVLIEASGSIGTNPTTLAKVAITGVDFISLGAITHSAPQFDVSLEFD